jgi:hypothetical protein
LQEQVFRDNSFLRIDTEYYLPSLTPAAGHRRHKAEYRISSSMLSVGPINHTEYSFSFGKASEGPVQTNTKYSSSSRTLAARPTNHCTEYSFSSPMLPVRPVHRNKNYSFFFICHQKHLSAISQNTNSLLFYQQ